MDTIEVCGIRALGCHGLLPEERTRTQPFEVDLRLDVDLAPAAASDRLEDTVDYGALTMAVAHLIESESHLLVERLADRIVEVCLGQGSVWAVEVTVRKLRPPVAAHVASVGVTLRRQSPTPESV